MDYARLLAPRAPELARLARELYGRRPDLRAAFPDPEAADFRQWLGVNGVLEDERIARFYPPIPPEPLRSTACGGPTIQSHLFTGAEDFRTVAELFEIFSGRPIQSLQSVLDFGCGCGRLLRWFATTLPTARQSGADVRAASIVWCRQNLQGTFLANCTVPPLDLPDEAFELTIALSVFSHLNLDQNVAWLRELARVTRRDGLLLVTTHGAFALAACARHVHLQNLLEMTADEARVALRNLHRDRFVHVGMPVATLRAAEGVAADYGQAFFSEQFVQERWSEFVEVLGCVPVALNLFQDFHVLRPRR